jgi:DNA-binding Lrp family transcriptional regulator
LKINKVDKKILDIIQLEFPLSMEPFSELGIKLRISDDQVIDRIKKLKAAGIIRFIGPVLNARSLGYAITLAAVSIPAKELDDASRIIASQPMVSHCYQRDHNFNLWFTLAVPLDNDLEDEVTRLGELIKAESVLSLPATKIFKLQAYFGTSKSGPKANSSNLNIPAIKGKDFSENDRAVINGLQQDLPLTARPFDSMSMELGMDADEFLSRCQTLLRRGIMRRYNASLSHYKLGFTANAMVCWRVPSDMVNIAGRKIATFSEVSHCYERKTNSLWPYNMFAMVHADSGKNCNAAIDKINIAAELDKVEHAILFSTREVKKTRVIYRV